MASSSLDQPSLAPPARGKDVLDSLVAVVTDIIICVRIC